MATLDDTLVGKVIQFKSTNIALIKEITGENVTIIYFQRRDLARKVPHTVIRSLGDFPSYEVLGTIEEILHARTY